jgi:phospho-N-acetylmuramoyl-pentapeptide-transferase
MAELLGLIIVSFFVTAFFLVPFIDLLFYYRSRRAKNSSLVLEQKSNTPIHDKLMKKDFDTPVGGGILIIPIVILLSSLVFYFTHKKFSWEIAIIFFSLLSFGALGLVDDLRHIYSNTIGKFKGLSPIVILLFQIIFAVFIAVMLYSQVGLNNIFIPMWGNVILGWWYIPLAAFVIITFANAFNISDGMDGLSTGLLTICLFAFLALANSFFDQNLAIFTGIWIGALIAYLYFNVFPARVHLGDAGAFGFGATLAVVGLLTGKILALMIIGGVFLIIISSSFFQILFKKIFKRKLIPVAPIHFYFKYIGWEEPKIVMRFWLAGAMLAIFGLWLALLSK